MKRLWVAAALAPLSFAAMAAPLCAKADTTVSSGTKTPLATSTSGNITVNSGGTIVPSAGPTAVTVDSNANVSNSGTIGFSGVGNSTAILIEAGNTSLVSGNAVLSVSNVGTIENDETTTGDTTNQSITTGPFANGANRTGIEVAGPGVYEGGITNTGAITIIGENSAGIDIGAEMNGALVTTGTITVTGGTPTATDSALITTNSGNISYAIVATGKIDGNVNLGGTITATGENATGVALSDVGGGIIVDGSITSTGYRDTTAPTDPDVLDKLNGDQTLQGGSALEIGGNVAGGVTIDAAVAASGNTSAVAEGTIITYGGAPAVMIGGANAIALGANTNGYSFENDGAISGLGAYPDVSATGVQIGGTNESGQWGTQNQTGNGTGVTVSGVAGGGAFGNVSLADGFDNTGSITVTTEERNYADSADAIGVKIGAGATVSRFINTGSIIASSESDVLIGGNTSPIFASGNGVIGNSVIGNKMVPITVSAIDVEAGGSLTTLNNNGLIEAAITGIPTAVNFSAQGGTEGQAVAVLDASGTLTNVTNTNTISASITPINYGSTVNANYSTVVALYLANQGNNVTVVQNPYVNTGNTNVTVTPTITGDIIFGNASNPSVSTGAESLQINAGNVTGNIVYNGSGNNSLTINSGNSVVTGSLTQVAGGSIAINVAAGELDMTAPVNTYFDTITGNTAALTGNVAVQSLSVSSLHVGDGGEIIFTINPNAGNVTKTPQFNVAGNATLDTGATLGVALTSKVNGTETFDLIHAGQVVGDATSVGLVGSLPFLYTGTVTETATDVDLTVTLKSTKELGLNPSQASAFDAIFSQISTDTPVEQLVLSQTTKAGFTSVYNQFLPDYAGGTFESMASAQREIARAEADPPEKLQTDETRGWVQEIGFDDQRDGSSEANGYQARGFGLAAGAEHARGDSAVGLAAAIISSGVMEATQAPDASLSELAIEGGAYWRAGGEGLNMNASVNGGYVSLGSHRLLLNQTSTGTVSLLRDAESQWSGAVASATFGVAYQMQWGRFYIRPELSADYIALYESAHSEKGGGDALDLAINSRFSKEASAEGDVVLGWNFGDSLVWRPELTLGWRQVLTGGPDSTVARFLSGGDTFTLTPDQNDKGGVLARLGIRATGAYADISADGGGEFRNGYQSYGARAMARFLF